MNDYIYALPVTQPFKNINIYNNNCYSTAFTTTIETTTTNTTGTITVNKNIVCDDVSNDQKDYCYNYVTEPQQFESIPLSLFNVQKQNDSIVNDEYYVSEGNLLNSNNNNNLIINNHNNASLNCYNILPTQSYPFYPVKHNELTKNVYNSTQTNYFNKNDLDVQTQTNYISDNVDHNTTNITATTTDNNNNNTNNSIQLPTNNTYEYHQQITPTNEQHFYTSNLLDKFITKNDWNQQTMITESSNIIKCKTQNSLCHSSYELCNNQLLKNYAENSTEFIRLNE
ncbi:unnamed protein product [Schistosoma margrebowiei]|uniref:Uncharacterized protein n=1 Tax=Schistosoma margrebowiei TaxID=48269 RepID=A0A183M9A5_9TREM|nr:unnamed protein product [Schistosoma margrebowiei]